eukprot:4745785-Pyramimonas_sp.AAC.1
MQLCFQRLAHERRRTHRPGKAPYTSSAKGARKHRNRRVLHPAARPRKANRHRLRLALSYSPLTRRLLAL